jgi:hypothetical protein
MSAATAEINTPERPGITKSYPLAAATKVFAGTIGALNSSGYLVPASNADGLRVVGRVEETVDNSAGSAGDLGAPVKEGVFQWNNSASSAVDPDDVGKFCYVEDDNTVAEAITSHAVKAGRVVEVDSAGVWVDTRCGVPAVVSIADGITGAADLAALKPILVTHFRALGTIK